MSLQVWLPLNGDLHNQGLENITTTIQTAVINDNGKIGKCYSFNGSNQQLRMTFPSAVTSAIGSLSCWIKFNAFPASGEYMSVIKICDLGGYSKTLFGITMQGTNQMAVCIKGTATNNTYTHSLSTGIWYHLCVVYDGTKIKIYLNGSVVLDKAAQTSSLTSVSSLHIGGSDNYYLNGYMNDVRYYNHALSPKEVEEIAKGLVLHYPLNNSANNINWLLPNSETTITRASGNTFVDYNYYSDLITNSETSYIVDFYAKGSVDAMKMDVYFRDSSSSYALTPQQTLTTAWEHYSLSLSGSPSSLQLFRARCYGGTAGDFISIRNMRLLSNNMPIRTSIIYDSSGYSHNGTITGSLTAAASSPRYDVATTFPTKDDYFYFPHLVDSTAMNNEFTFSCWLYRDYTDAASKYIYYGLCAIYLSSSFKPCISWTHASEDLSYNQNNAYAPSAAPVIPLQTWTHLVWVFQNGVLYCYVNGQQAASNDRSSNGTYIRGTRGSDASIGYTWIGKISDVRTYATALTAEQVKELYNTSMSVDSNGNVYARELSEL